MANKITTTYALEVGISQRLEPRYYYNQSLLKKSFDNFGFEKIGEFATLKSGSTPEHHDEKQNKDDIHFVKSADVKRYNLNFSTISFITKEIHNLRLNSKVIPNDILLSNTGKYLGFACIIPNTISEGNINQNIVRIRFKDKHNSKLTPQFLLAFLNSQFGQIEIESLLTLTGQKYLNMEKFRDYKIPKMDTLFINEISLKIKKIENDELEALSLIRQAQKIFYQELGVDFSGVEKKMFYGVDYNDFEKQDMWTPAFYSPLYIKTISAIKKKNKTVLLGELADFKNGDEVGSANYKNYLDKKDSDVPFIRTSDIVNYEIDQYPDFYIEKEIFEELGQDTKEGEILFTKDGKIGLTAMLTKNDKCILSSGLLRIMPKAEKIDPYYLFIALSIKEIGQYQAKQRTVIASTIPHLREDRIADFEIPILKNQKEIIELIKEAFKLKNKRKLLIREVKEILEKETKL